MKRRRRNLTLLEVMISFTLIALCLYPLISPHVTYYKAQHELARKIQLQMDSSNWFATFYEELIRSERGFETLPFQEFEAIDELPANARYRLEVKKEKKGKERTIQLLEMIITSDLGDLSRHNFVVERHPDED